MNKIMILGGVAAVLMAGPALAQDRAGQVQLKLVGTAVLPDGKIEQVNLDRVGLPATLQTRANDNFTPTIAIEYFFTNNFSVETIAGITQHDVDATAGLPVGAELVADAKLIPATITAKYHFDLGGVKPYIGAGPSYFLWVAQDPGAAVRPLGVTSTKLSNELGLALQAGVDVPLNDKGFALTLDAKRYFIGTTASWFVGNTRVIETEHKLDPWVLSAGLAYRF
ncbi:MAG: OmpW/AlkL family protein [Erythrobacter sp.]|jgi:outer membrane protein